MESYIRLTRVAQFLGLKKHVLRKWLQLLEPIASRPSRERSASEFNAADLLFLEVARILVCEAGMSIESVAKFSEQLFDVLQRPWSLNPEESLVLSRSFAGQWQFSRQSSSPAVSIEIPLGTARMKIFQALGVSESWQQSELQLGLMATDMQKRHGT